MAVNLFDEVGNEGVDPAPLRDKGKGKAKERTSKTTTATASTDGGEFTINEAFAGKYEQKKRGEELSKLKDKYGSDYEGSETESEDLSSEDSDAEFITPEVDAAILRTLVKIKRGDPSIYQGTNKVYDEDEVRKAVAQSAPPLKGDRPSHSKPLLLRDYQRRALIATRGRSSSITSSTSSRAEDPTPAQEATRLRAETKRAFFGDDEAADSDGVDDLLVPREVTQGEAEEEQEAYRRFLMEQVGKQGIEEALRLEGRGGESGSAPEGIEDSEAFLREYILGRGWMDKKSRSIPRYTELVGEDNDRGKNEQVAGPSGANAVDLFDEDEDEEHFERAEAFESKYNFRFEDEGGADLVTHARDAGASVRRQDDSRKLARQAVKERKAEEKKARMEERERLKELKRQEILEKLNRIRKSAGDEDFNIEGYDLDGDFDPDAHDRHMTTAFDEAFYGRNDIESGKPTWEDDLDLDKYGDEDDAGAVGVDFEPGGDAYDPLAASNGKGSKRQKQRDKKKSKKKQRVEEALADDGEGEAEGALTLEQQKAQLGEDLKEYEEMDFEDMIGDMPMRFKYAQVECDTFALSPAEILLATDAELNEYVGLKKLAPYRAHRHGNAKKESQKRKKKLKELKEKLATRKWGEDEAGGGESAVSENKKRKRGGGQDAGGGTADVEKVGPPKKRKGKKERQKAKVVDAAATVDGVEASKPQR